MKNTKEKLLRTAADLFAKHGVDGVSTRELAKKSGVNLCSINYYFGTKQGLYEAVIEDISSFILNNFVAKTHANLAENCSLLVPRDEIKYFLSSFFAFICSEKVFEVKIELLLRELLYPSSAYNNFYARVLEPLHKRISHLISTDLGLAEESTQSILLTHALLGQVVMFKIHQEALLRRLGAKKYTPEIIAETQKLLIQNCDAILDKAKGA